MGKTITNVITTEKERKKNTKCSLPGFKMLRDLSSAFPLAAQSIPELDADGCVTIVEAQYNRLP